ncbi:MAG: protein kinase [Simplicispira sp.]|nr:protein kinase [Simplicispira sp.]
MTASTSAEPRSKMRHMDALPVGTRLAEFEILGLLGVGGFGMVYKAFDHSLHRTVAIKEYMPATLAARGGDGALWARSSTDEPAFQAGLHSFVDEARMLAQFDHPSLVKVFRFWEAHNTAYMVMPLYRGMTFKQARTQMRAPPSEAWLRQVLWAVLDALRVLHGANTLHRDISPDNIFLQDVGPPVLLDLGASRHAINDRDRKHTAVLKVNYAPIEQYADNAEDDGHAGMEQGPWSDLYSLGAVVYGCLCNDAPLPATLRALRDRMVPFSRVARTVRKQFGQEYSAPFVEAISQALKLQPEDRPQSIDAFLALMDMRTPPAGLDQFDFRAGLGELWVEPTDQPDATLTASTVDLTGQGPAPVSVPRAAAAAVPPISAPAARPAPPQADPREAEVADTVFLGQDSVLREPDSVQPAAAPASAAAAPAGAAPLESEWTRARASAPPARRAPWVWTGAGVLGLALVAVVWGLRSPSAPPPQPAAPDTIITELKPVEAPPAVPAASTAAPALVAASEPEATGPAPAFVAADDPRAVSKAPPRAARAAQGPKTAPLPVPPPAPEPEPVPEAPPPSPPAPAPRRAPPPLCADANVLTRSMCLREECAKPGNAGRSACIDFRKAIEPLERNRFAN